MGEEVRTETTDQEAGPTSRTKTIAPIMNSLTFSLRTTHSLQELGKIAHVPILTSDAQGYMTRE